MSDYLCPPPPSSDEFRRMDEAMREKLARDRAEALQREAERAGSPPPPALSPQLAPALLVLLGVAGLLIAASDWSSSTMNEAARATRSFSLTEHVVLPTASEYRTRALIAGGLGSVLIALGVLAHRRR